MNVSGFIFNLFYEFIYMTTIVYNKIASVFCCFEYEDNELIINIKAIKSYPTITESNYCIKNFYTFTYLQLNNHDLYIINNKKKNIITNNRDTLDKLVSKYFKNKNIFDPPSEKTSILSFCINYNNNTYEIDLDKFNFLGNNLANKTFIFWYLDKYYNINLSNHENSNYTISYIDSNANIYENISTNSLIL